MYITWLLGNGFNWLLGDGFNWLLVDASTAWLISGLASCTQALQVFSWVIRFTPTGQLG